MTGSKMSRVLRQRGRDPQQQGLTITSEACPSCLLSSVRSRLIKLPQVFQKAPATIWLPSNQTQELVGDRSLSDLRRVRAFLWGTFPSSLVVSPSCIQHYSNFTSLVNISVKSYGWRSVFRRSLITSQFCLFPIWGCIFFFTTVLATIYCCINFTNV